MLKHIGVIADLRTPRCQKSECAESRPVRHELMSLGFARKQHVRKTTAIPPITRPATTGFAMTANGAFPARCDKRENNAPDPSNTRARAYPSAMQGTNQTGSSAPIAGSARRGNPLEPPKSAENAKPLPAPRTPRRDTARLSPNAATRTCPDWALRQACFPHRPQCPPMECRIKPLCLPQA